MRLIFIALAVCVITPAMACAPSPSCYMTESKTYLKSVCAVWAKDKLTFEGHVDAHSALADIDKKELERDVRKFIAACKRLGYDIVK